MNAHTECSLKLLKFEMSSFICFPSFSQFIFFLHIWPWRMNTLVDCVTQGLFTIHNLTPIHLTLGWSASIISDCWFVNNARRRLYYWLEEFLSRIYSSNYLICFLFYNSTIHLLTKLSSIHWQMLYSTCPIFSDNPFDNMFLSTRVWLLLVFGCWQLWFWCD